jgi:hypothetical protein
MRPRVAVERVGERGSRRGILHIQPVNFVRSEPREQRGTVTVHFFLAKYNAKRCHQWSPELGGS